LGDFVGRFDMNLCYKVFMDDSGWATFDTPIGVCGIAWGPRGVRGVQLPEGSQAATRSRIARRFPDSVERKPPPSVTRAIEEILSLLKGGKAPLRRVSLDTAAVPPFRRRVYDLARSIPPGRTLTYGELAVRIGSPGSARAVGQALGRNPFPLIVPCHRVLAAGGRLGGFSAAGGVDAKRRLLAIESGATSAAAPRPARRSRRAPTA
jgi:methylated-DNA-[protein]-cysteine S-methyltransferase